MLHSYDYVYIRVVPRVERGAFINAGMILFCRPKRFLAAFAPKLDPAIVAAQLDLIPRICRGEGPIGALALAERFHWLVAPHSTVIQSSAVHTGLCHDPAAVLETLLASLQD